MIAVHLRTAGFGHHRGQGAMIYPRAGGYVLELGGMRRRAAPAPDAHRLATGLEAPISDGRRPYIPALAAVEADRGFSAGNGYLTGLIIDRSA